jgi:uncharacterized DUF497 family protein
MSSTSSSPMRATRTWVVTLMRLLAASYWKMMWALSSAVAHTYSATGANSAKVRVISAREATKAERRQYENEPR